jgi:hypothetical protein
MKATPVKGNPVDYQLPGDFIEAIKTRPVAEINAIFNALTQRKLAEIPGCTTTDQLLQIQAQAKYVQELHQFFLAEMQR